VPSALGGPPHDIVSIHVRKHGIAVLAGVNAWIDPTRKERRTIHANGDGTLVVDGRTIALSQKMVKWKESL
jgi:hypothetical protein